MGTDDKTCYILSPFEDKGIKKMKAKEIILEKKIILHHFGELVSELAGSSKLRISERLQGWTMELRKRTDGSEKFEKVFINLKYTH